MSQSPHLICLSSSLLFFGSIFQKMLFIRIPAGYIGGVIQAVAWWTWSVKIHGKLLAPAPKLSSDHNAVFHIVYLTRRWRRKTSCFLSLTSLTLGHTCSSDNSASSIPADVRHCNGTPYQARVVYLRLVPNVSPASFNAVTLLGRQKSVILASHTTTISEGTHTSSHIHTCGYVIRYLCSPDRTVSVCATCVALLCFKVFIRPMLF